MPLDAYAAILTIVEGTASIVALLDESPAVTDSDGRTWAGVDRIFVNAIPEGVIEASDTYHPPKTIVLSQAGGEPKFDLSPLEKLGLSLICYGESDQEADRVRREVYDRLIHNTSRECVSDVHIHHVNAAGGPVSLRDPEIVWPAVSQSFTFQANTEVAA